MEIEEIMMKKKTWLKRFFVIILTFILVTIIGGWIYLEQATYSPTKEAETTSLLGDDRGNVLVFEGKTDYPAIIFYQGALVEKESYSIWASKIAEVGYSVYLVQMPLNLAVLNGNIAEEIISEYELEEVVMGGHSLGGVMSSRFAATHSNQVKGVFFLASYPDEKGSLANFSQPVLSITAGRDGVLNTEAYEEAKNYLPESTEYVRIDGGNHAGFGSYGEQKGDLSSEINDQQEQLQQILIEWLNELD